ncbi:MAG: type II toxin-antitoxin system Phd/YefM family antitoxin [Fibromonadaceae bacterium]|jgi:prevent-host-death family protein|nr:type II toxin-antitoxin system Phd/YefM family antitoxin [Fibromonadaceae bacterium]
MVVNVAENIKPVSYIKSNASDVMDYVYENKNPVIITKNGEAIAVLVDIETYQKTQDAFALLNIIKLGEDDIKAKRTKKASVVFSEIKGRLQGQAR